MNKTIPALVLCGLASLPAYGMDLLEAYELGLKSDPLVLQAEAKRNAIQKNRPINLAKLLPNVSFNGDYTQNHTSTQNSFITTQQFTDVTYQVGEFTLRLSQPVFHYDYWVQLWQADNQIAQAQAQLEAAYQDLAMRVATNYFNVLYGEENLEVTAMQLHSLDVQIEQVKERLAVGFSSLVDLNAIQAKRDQVAADLIVADQKLNDAKESLREILGNIDIDLAKVPEQVALNKPQPEDIEAWRDMAMKNNMDIIAAMSGAEVAKQTIDVNSAGHLPTVDIQGTKGLYHSNRPPYGLDNDSETIGLYVNVPVFSGGGVNAKVEQARDYYAQAMAQVDQQRRATQRQVKDAYRGVFAAIGEVGALATAVKSAEVALEASQLGFQVGTQSAVDLLVQQNTYFQARRDYARARYDYLRNGLLLKQAAGTLARDDIDAVNALIHRPHAPGLLSKQPPLPGQLPTDEPSKAAARSPAGRKLEPWRVP
ncbi:outer membrane protein [Methylomagnum ishizawai]|uniref:Outer membrane protein n=1 Tax=Methylomagnum ishizawai TaxID=1760988 RepID=A0A1Y6CWJ2_9GAMM|nr:TolC family outer membrane protein [Methylomagnum ishizawai]SMF95039.1 outer membrane protein [Methylomagnum ishizawai]